MDKPRWFWPAQFGLLLMMLLCTALVMWGDDIALPIPNWVILLIGSSAMMLLLINIAKTDTSSVRPENRAIVINILRFVFGVNCVVIFLFFISQLF